MAGVHFRWRKCMFQARWKLHGAPGLTACIVMMRDAQDSAPAYAWSVRRSLSEAPDDLVTAGVAATLSEAHLFASRAIFVALQGPVERTAPAPTAIRQVVS